MVEVARDTAVCLCALSVDSTNHVDKSYFKYSWIHDSHQSISSLANDQELTIVGGQSRVANPTWLQMLSNFIAWICSLL
jgi:hypothetical protein